MTSAPSLPAIAMPPPATLLVSRARVPPHKRDLTHFLSANASGRDWLVGDVHGHFSRLKAAMDAAGFNPLQDRLLSVGDLVDRGPESPAVIEWLSQPWFYAIRGNHEQMFLEYHAQPSAAARRRYMARAWEANGGAWAARLTEAQRTAIAEQLQRLPYLMAVDVGAGVPLLLAHACMPSGSAWPTLLNEPAPPHWCSEVLWSRSFWRRASQATPGDADRRTVLDESEVHGVLAVVVGHQVVPEPAVLGNHIYIDIGGWRPAGKFVLIPVDTIVQRMRLHGV